MKKSPKMYTAQTFLSKLIHSIYFGKKVAQKFWATAVILENTVASINNLVTLFLPVAETLSAAEAPK
jgi:hypothetical protein